MAHGHQASSRHRWPRWTAGATDGPHRPVAGGGELCAALVHGPELHYRDQLSTLASGPAGGNGIPSPTSPPSPSAAPSGSNSIFGTITSAGGGGGSQQATVAGAAGGSGGGGGANFTPGGGAGNTPPTSPSSRKCWWR